jgi:hypothetical protein
MNRNPPITLPPEAARRLSKLRAQVAKAKGAADGIQKQLRSNPPNSDHIWAADLQDDIVEQNATAARFSGLLGKVEDYLRKLPPNVELAMEPPQSSPLLKGERLDDCIDRLNDQIYAAINRKAAVKHAQRLFKERRQVLVTFAEQAGKTAAGYGRFEVALEPLRNLVHLGTFDMLYRHPDYAAWTAWFDPQKLIERLESELEPEQADAISESERAKRLAEEDSILDALERQRAFAIRQAGTEAWPEDTLPTAFLGVVEIRREERPAAA